MAISKNSRSTTKVHHERVALCGGRDEAGADWGYESRLTVTYAYEPVSGVSTAVRKTWSRRRFDPRCLSYTPWNVVLFYALSLMWELVVSLLVREACAEYMHRCTVSHASACG